MKIIPTENGLKDIEMAVATMGMGKFISELERIVGIGVLNNIGYNFYLWTNANKKETALINLMGFEICTD